MRRWCIGWPVGQICPNETSRYAKNGRRNPYWCAACDEARIRDLSEQFERLAARKHGGGM